MNFQQLTNGLRCDGEFYQPKYLALAQKLASMSSQRIGDIADVRSGTTPIDRSDGMEGEAILLKTINVQDGYINDGSRFFISNEINERMKSTQLQAQDVLVNIVGATLDVVGRVSPVPIKIPKMNITQAMAFVRVKSQDFLPYYIAMFLLSVNGV